jgi:hypothetical protein
MADATRPPKAKPGVKGQKEKETPTTAKKDSGSVAKASGGGSGGGGRSSSGKNNSEVRGAGRGGRATTKGVGLASRGMGGSRVGGLRRAAALALRVEVPGDADKDALEAVDALMSLSSGYVCLCV